MKENTQKYTISKARMEHVKPIHILLQSCAADGQLLPRSLTQLYGHMRDFFVIFDGEELVGCVALSLVWDKMAEVRSLAVLSHMRGKGCGNMLVEACIKEAKDLGITQLFALTYQVPFFQRHGFEIVTKEVLPQKIWIDCVHCVKFPDCDETAVLLHL